MNSFQDLGESKKYYTHEFNRFLNTDEEYIEEMYSQASLEKFISKLIDIEIIHQPQIVPIIKCNIGATPLALHMYNVTTVSILIGLLADLSPDDLQLLAMAAFLHDIGKKYVSNDILYKDRRLAQAEMYAMQMHPQLGKFFVQEHYPHLDARIVDAILMHHERLDGTGYYHYEANEINKYAQIITVADIFSGITEERAYHPSRDFYQASDILLHERGLNAKYVEYLRNTIEKIPKSLMEELTRH